MFSKFAVFGPSFTTKELLRRCFAKTKVIRYTAFFESAENYFSEQFHMAASLCISHIPSQKEDSCPANNCMFKVNNTKTRQVVKCVQSLG